MFGPGKKKQQIELIKSKGFNLNSNGSGQKLRAIEKHVNKVMELAKNKKISCGFDGFPLCLMEYPEQYINLL